MIRIAILLILLMAGSLRSEVKLRAVGGLAGGGGSGGQSGTPSGSTLRWKNQETISGELYEATGTELSWKSELFDEPLRLRWDSVLRIDHPRGFKAASERFGIVLRDGSHLIGDVVALDEDSLRIRSERHGAVVLKRTEILRIRCVRPDDLLLGAGPAGDVGWYLDGADGPSGGGQTDVSRLINGPGGTLVMPYWNTKAALRMNTPDRIEFEVVLRFSAVPAFSLRFDGDANNGIRLESWGSDLVVTSGDEFKFVREIKEDERELILRVRWDRLAKKGAIYGIAPEPLAEWTFNGAIGQSSDWLLHNQGMNLEVTHFRLRKWDDAPIGEFRVPENGLILSDGRSVEGVVTRVSNEEVSVTLAAGGESSNFPLREVSDILISGDIPKQPTSGTRLSFWDGTLCNGVIEAVREGKILLRSSASSELLPVSIAGLRQLRWNDSRERTDAKEGPSAEREEKKGDEIFIDGTRLSGTMAGGEDGRLRWLPPGGVAPAAPDGSRDVRIMRALRDEPESVSALIYTRFGDVIPGTLRGITNDALEIAADILQTRELPVSVVNAVQFSGARPGTIRGFDAQGWKIFEGGEDVVRLKDGTLEIEHGGAYGHSHAMQAEEVQFAFDPANCGAFRIQLFTGGEDEKSGINLIIAPNATIIYVGLEANGEVNGYSSVSTDGMDEITLRFRVNGGYVELYTGDRLVRRLQRDLRRRGGSGIVIEATDAFVGTGDPVKLAKFLSKTSPSRRWVPDIQPEARTQALTIPRFRKDRLPKHVLVAMNGDLLRGEIEAVTPTHLGFLAGLENLRVPRSRVHAAIWLKPMLEGARGPEPSDRNLAALDETINVHTNYGSVPFATLISFLRRNYPALRFAELPRVPSSMRMSMAFGGQTVREALEQIAAGFNLKFRIQDGNISFEAAPPAGDDVIERTYLLNEDAFTNDEGATEWLKSEGVELPSGSAARWNPDTCQLKVSHMRAVHGKIREALKRKFGEKSFEITHWLLLSNGGRFGLHVERFGPNEIVGKHPGYGPCKIPLAQVLTIQMSDPGTTESGRLFDRWHLTAAREPVIADADGESAPSVGVPAGDFKLPLFNGGEFDLAAERGKVVVLDFWATWCAPCIKSIPGLIEAMSTLPGDRVRLIGVNQGESVDAVRRFLEVRDWKFTVAMDVQQKVGRQYGVTGIPHTVIVGPDGRVAWVKTGYSATGAAEAVEVIKKLIDVAGQPEERKQPAGGE